MAETAAQQQYPDLNPYTSSNGASVEEKKESIMNSASHNAQHTMDNIKNSETVQSIANGPVADKARNEAAATQNEFGNLAASRQTPQTQAATGQDLTHYHSFFYSLLSWENPRVTAISYATTVLVTLVGRYVPVARYALRALYLVLGVMAALEIAGKATLGEGIASKFRPRKYYRIPRENLESALGDVEELINFFVIEFQRIIFAENVYATVAAFFSSLLTYFLVKVMPNWGLFLFFTTLVYLAPLVYISNKQFIDEHINNASSMLSEQTGQFRDIAAQKTSKAVEMSQSTIKEYTAKAQEAIGQTKKTAVDQGYVAPETADKVAPEKAVSNADFPSAPKQEPVGLETTHTIDDKAEPMLA